MPVEHTRRVEVVPAGRPWQHQRGAIERQVPLCLRPDYRPTGNHKQGRLCPNRKQLGLFPRVRQRHNFHLPAHLEI